MRSLRSRLMLGTAVATLIIFAAAAITLFLLTRLSLLNDFDITSLAKARTLASMAEVSGDHVNIEDLNQLAEFHRPKHPEFLEIRTHDGTAVFKSPSLNDRDLPMPSLAEAASSKGRFIELPGDRDGRMLSISFAAHGDEDATISPKFAAGLVLTVARETDPMDDILGMFSGLLAIVCGVAIIAMLIVTTLVIRRGLRPVNDLAGEIGQIGETNLSAKLTESAIPHELSPIVTRLNDLLSRLSSAFDREKSFTADAAHELRTPLAGLESALEVCLRQPRDGKSYETVVRDCLDVVRQMHSMVDGLLLLSRTDAKLVTVSRSNVSINAMFQEVWQRFEDRAAQRNLRVAWNIDDNLNLQIDPEKFRAILSNLLDNAVHYTNTGGQIQIAANRAGETISIRIANSGSTVSADDAGKVFDRFWRGDPSRSETGANCGLGLAVCKKLIELMHGSIIVSSEVGREFILELIFPV